MVKGKKVMKKAAAEDKEKFRLFPKLAPELRDMIVSWASHSSFEIFSKICPQCVLEMCSADIDSLLIVEASYGWSQDSPHQA